VPAPDSKNINTVGADGARETRARRFAQGVAVLGLTCLLVVISLGKVHELTWPLLLFGLATLGMGLLAFSRLEPRFVSTGLLLALAAMSVVFLTLHGPGPASAVFLFTLPTAATVLAGAGLGRALSGLLGVAFTAALAFGFESSNPWFVVAVTFLGLLAVLSLLLGGVLQDFDRVFLEYEEASSALATAGRLRIAAEEARDKALLLRNESRSVEALGVVAGSVVHDLNNMAQVIRTWTHEILQEERPGTARDAAEAIAAACDRVTTLAGDVLALGQADADAAAQVPLTETMPKAARALRRYVPESIRLVMDAELPLGLPPFPLTGADVVHLVLEGAASLNVASTTSGTLLLSAPRAIEVEIPPPHPGMSRYPVALVLELRRDTRGRGVPKALAWRESSALFGEGKDLLCTSEVCVLLFTPSSDVVVMVVDLFPAMPAEATPSKILALSPLPHSGVYSG
jgi:signal transduction histidine kinase